ncbi:hypothetical protein A3C32_04215 [Candidatus Daviesbacteria bacterium RIFCSPHIGHO2_02_FULL_41_14]|uniref:Polysaccharide biosynthesis protein C-terminal domain-containing protein n=1 Tax=Candidatus Daviesbacteria bacterium RIFCSPLOWO2_01_FULL_40_24 TaxID=1797787 RepID=A0A1F5MJ81_9BACT|nr:MAG: hypothetical protein A3C32_04215 [Candidatus Daviesbacteria bacterium RIFCSPHIGHO2_02_FULL_41_14]OGE65431.1 MAG: hypothetical protein A3B49_00910 [Candidatus Daviesbacteria bacterium RIFCSPLOWO2_01_FULL_40_24]
MVRHLPKFSKFLKTVTFRQTSITVIATMINGILGFIFFAVLARYLGPVNFGLFITTITVLTLMSDIADLGVNTSIVKFAASLQARSDSEREVLKIGLVTKIIVSLTVAVIGYLLSDIIANTLFNKSDLVFPLRLASLGVIGALLFSYVTSYLQAKSRFLSWGGLNISLNLGRLILIGLLVSSQSLTILNSLIAYLIFPILGFVIALGFMPIIKILTVKVPSESISQFFNYSKWAAVFIAITALSSRVDIFLSARILNTQQLGFYVAAAQLLVVIPQLASALGLVFSPKYSNFSSLGSMISYYKKTQILVIIPSVVALLLIPFASFIIQLTYGEEYIAAAPIFVILLLAMLIFLISIPIHNAILYYFSDSKFFTFLSFGHIIIMLTVGFYLISQYQAVGTALAVLIGSLFNLLVPGFYLFRRIRK